MTGYDVLPDMPERPRRTEYDEGWFAQYGRESSSFGQRLGSYYRDVKRWIIATRGPSCEACGVALSTPDEAHRHLVTHHVIPKADGGGDEASNLLLLCGDCHSSQHDFRLSRKARPQLPAEAVRPVQADRFLSLAQLVDAAKSRALAVALGGTVTWADAQEGGGE